MRLAATFLVNATGPGLSYQWQFDNGSGWNDLIEGGVYTGTTSQQLRIDNATLSENGQYRLAVIADCRTVYSDPADLVVDANPVVDFSGIDPLFNCGGTDMQLDGNPTGGSGTWVTHNWTGQTGPLDNLIVVDPVFNTSIPGTYSLTYRVTDDKGCTASDNLSINVERPTALFNPDITYGCPPLTINFNDASTSGTVYRWDFGDGSPIDNTAGSTSHEYVNNSTMLLYYDVKLEVETANGCDDDYTVGVTVYPQAESDFTIESDTICSGEYGVLSSPPGAYQYFWDFGDGAATYGGSVISHLYLNGLTTPATYNIGLTTTSFYGCDAIVEKPVVVYPMPDPMFTADPPSQTFPSATVNFTNTTNAGTWNWLWRFGDGSTSTTMDPVHSYTAPGNFNVSLTASNDECTDSVKYVVAVLPTAPVAAFDSVPGACAPYTVTFTNNSLYADQYVWDFGDGGHSEEEMPEHTFLLGGIYRVRLTAVGPGGSDYKDILVRVYDTPTAYFNAIPDSVFVDDERVRFFNLSQGADYYIWDFGDGDTSHVSDPFHLYLKEGTFPVSLYAYSNNGCYNSYTLLPGIKVIPAGALRFATVFRPNPDGPLGGDVSNLPSSKIDMVFFPPVKEQIDNYKLQIFNRAGVLIFESFDINFGWDGYYRNKKCMQGVYVWYVEGNYTNGKPYKKVGDITLLH